MFECEECKKGFVVKWIFFLIYEDQQGGVAKFQFLVKKKCFLIFSIFVGGLL